MAKRIVAKTGEYTDNMGNQKARWQNVGVIMQSNDGGEFILLDPNISLAGLMQSQNTTAANKGEQLRDRILCSIFEDDNQQHQQQAPQQHQQQGYQQAPQQHHQQQAPQQGYQQPGK